MVREPRKPSASFSVQSSCHDGFCEYENFVWNSCLIVIMALDSEVLCKLC